jgi:hypothetical protein
MLARGARGEVPLPDRHSLREPFRAREKAAEIEERERVVRGTGQGASEARFSTWDLTSSLFERSHVHQASGKSGSWPIACW